MKEQRFDKQQLKSAIKFKSTNMLWKSLFPITSSDTQKQSIPVKLKED